MDSEFQTINLNVKELRTKTVIVYGDRAEIKRHIELDLPTPGKYTILVQVKHRVFRGKSMFRTSLPLSSVSQFELKDIVWLKLVKSSMKNNR